MPRIARRKSRENAIIVLYQRDLLGKKISEILESNSMADREYDEFTLKLVKGVDKHKKSIDSTIMGVVKNWSLKRIAIIDRNILRVAIYEMLYEDDIPLKVSVDEAIEIAKSLGQKEDTPKFINGILGKILNNMNG